MAQNRIIETMGSIAKVEKLQTLSSNILENTLVLDEAEPFPGYHGANLPTGYNPNYVYIVLKKKLSTVMIMRMTQNIKKYFKHDFDGTAASICINNDVLDCIRVRNLEKYSYIPELQKNYLHEGVKFMKKREIMGEGIIDINKHFILEELEPGIFKDLEDSHMHYFRIPHHLNWQMFLEMTTSIRHNIDNLHFDTALGAIYLKEIHDVVRIFTKDLSLEELRTIRNMYAEELKKY
jgi:hypothetical protein